MVEVDLNTPLPNCFFSNEYHGENSVNYKYEKLLPNLCYTCGRIGHQQGSCEFKEKWKKDRYGDHTRVGQHSPLAPTLL
ncbi:hypothetical protein LINGRAHAP2_LOCUS30343 [Linum grandiflorum]